MILAAMAVPKPYRGGARNLLILWTCGGQIVSLRNQVILAGMKLRNDERKY